MLYIIGFIFSIIGALSTIAFVTKNIVDVRNDYTLLFFDYNCYALHDLCKNKAISSDEKIISLIRTFKEKNREKKINIKSYEYFDEKVIQGIDFEQIDWLESHKFLIVAKLTFARIFGKHQIELNKRQWELNSPRLS